WPVKPGALAADSIPLAGQGVPMSPDLADVDGDGRDEVAVTAFTGEPELYRGDGTRLAGSAEPQHFQSTGTGSGSRATAPIAPAIADVGGDGKAEVIAGSSGDVLHAFREDGTEPPGWPKQTGNWLLASPAVGDIDGDGRLDVVVPSRDGWLFAWRTPARVGA